MNICIIIINNNLTHLNFKDCKNFIEFPKYIINSNNVRVRVLSFRNCPNLTYIPSISTLEELYIFECPLLVNIPEKSLIPNLRILQCSNGPGPQMKLNALLYIPVYLRTDSYARYEASRLIGKKIERVISSYKKYFQQKRCTTINNSLHSLIPFSVSNFIISTYL